MTRQNSLKNSLDEDSRNQTCFCLGHVTEDAMKQQIRSFLDCIERNVLQQRFPLVVVFIAAHEQQLQSTELPCIVPSDSNGSLKSLVDLDFLLLRPLDAMKAGKLKVWFVVDTCRENKDIHTWIGDAADRPFKRYHWRSQTDFQILLACDRGRVARDQPSMTMALLHAMKTHQTDLETLCKEAQASIQETSRGRQRPWRYCRGDFSGIFLPDEERPSMCLPLAVVRVLMLATGCLTAVIVLVFFWLVLESIDLKAAIEAGRHAAGCPDQSCFCTDCDPCMMFNAGQRHWQEFDCRWWVFSFNRCYIALLLNLGWYIASLLLFCKMLYALQQDWQSPKGEGSFFLMILVVCSLNIAPVFERPLPPDVKCFIVALGYNIVNTCYLSSGIVVVLRLLSLQSKLQNCGLGFNLLAREFLRGFFPTAILGELFVMQMCHHTDSSEEFIEHEVKFYIMFLYLGMICAFIASWLSRTIIVSAHGNARDELIKSKLRKVSRRLFRVKALWCGVFTAQTVLGCKPKFQRIATKYHIFVVINERFCALQILLLIKKFAETYEGLRQIPF